NSLLVPQWATWDEFRRLEALGLTMFGQMTAGSWIYIGTQGILQGTYQTFAAAGERHFGAADLTGRTILTAGLGGMGGAQPLAATMLGGAILCVEVDPARIRRRLDTRYLDEATDSLEDALTRVRAAAAERRPLSVGLQANAADVVPELARRGEQFDLVTDQTAAHDPLTGYVPASLSVEEAAITTIDATLRSLFPDDGVLQRWLELAPGRVAFQGLPARICWLGYGDRARAGLAINELVCSGQVKAPVVIGRDHLDSGSVASPYR